MAIKSGNQPTAPFLEWAAWCGEKRPAKKFSHFGGTGNGGLSWREKRSGMFHPGPFFLSESQTSAEGHSGGREARNEVPAAILSEGPAAVDRASWAGGTAWGHTRQGVHTTRLGSDHSFQQPERGDKPRPPDPPPSTGQGRLYSLGRASRQGFQQNQK